MTDNLNTKHGNRHSARLIIGLMMIVISVILAVVFYFQTAIKSSTFTEKSIRESSATTTDMEMPRQETEGERLERLRQAALMEIDVMRRDAALEFQEAAAAHEQAVRIAMRNTINETIEEAHGRVPDYAEWIIGWEATLDMAKALWNDNLEEVLVAAAEKRLLSRVMIENRLNQVAVNLSQESGIKAEAIAMRYENRFAGLLAGFEEPVRMQIPPVKFLSVASANICNPVIAGNAMGMTSFIGSMLLVSFAADKFVQRLGKQITIKAGSKIVRIGSGPIGWVIGFAGGYMVEKGVDEYYVKPRLVQELNQQLDQVQTMLLGHDFIEKAASAQALPLHNIARELQQPITMAAVTQQEQISNYH
ncbi:MAG: hypothetical protein AB7V25_16860 [Mangrovibacterium sp.]